MQVNTVNVQSSEKENFKKLFRLKDNTTSKLEFRYNSVSYEISYDSEDLGWYNTNSRDQMILNFLEALTSHNKGNTQGVKAKLDHMVEKEPLSPNHKYKTIYKNNELKYILGLEDNIIKAACIEQGLTYQQLADSIGVSESSLRSSVSTNKVSKQVEKSIEMYLKIVHLEKELEKSNQIKNVLKSWLN